MTDEEMAEKYAIENWEHYEEGQNDSKALKRAYLAGAEFGYNKAIEWHRVSDKLPEMDVFVYLWKESEDFPVVARRHLPYGQKEWVWDCMWGSGFTISQLKGKDRLWKEIVLPKEIEEN